jgi:hypothetical protein
MNFLVELDLCNVIRMAALCLRVADHAEGRRP